MPSFGGGHSYEVALGDLDGDGDLDAVVANFHDEPETVWLNDGSGVFNPHPTTPSFGAGHSRSVPLGDLDGDGDLDAVVANAAGEAETVWLNDGSGGFSPHAATPSFGAGDSQDVALGDLDGDGDLDAVVANIFGQAETVWLNDGLGAFSPHPKMPSFGAGSSWGVALGDLDGDGDLDAVVANFFEQPETVWRNDGLGAFSPHPATPSFEAGNSYDLALGDLDGDGDLDAVVTNHTDLPETVWLNDGLGAFSPHPTTPSFGAGYTNGVALGDLDGDGDLDAVVADDSSTGNTVWRNDGLGAFSPHPATPSFGAGVIQGVALGDLDGDTDLDAVVAMYFGAETVWLNTTGVPPRLSIADASVTEGDSGITVATFTITRAGELAVASSVKWSTADGSAVAPGDYVAVAPTTVSFAPGEATKTVSVTVNGDTAVEPDDGFTVILSAPTGATIGDDRAVGRILNDESATLTIDDATVVEGNSATATAVFTVTRSGVIGGPGSVRWFTADTTAVAPEDYSAAAGTVEFAAGETTKAVSVSVRGDIAIEPEEAFVVRLTAAVGATIADGTAVGRIVNDDAALSVDDVSVIEGNSGTRAATFTITRTGSIAAAASVRWSTAPGTAAAPGDYTEVAPTTVDFAPGEATRTVVVSVNGDNAMEANETFQVRLSAPVGATIADGSGLGRITNDDISTLAVNDVTVTESNSGTTTATFTVTRSGAIAGTSTVVWSTEDGTATAASDYVGVAFTTVTFAPGQATATVSVSVNGDSAPEANETFVVRLSAPSGASIADGSGLGRITNDD